MALRVVWRGGDAFGSAAAVAAVSG
jgi:hypothetical protein